VTLQRVEVGGTDERLVITLTADGPISGHLEEIPGSTTRLFVDLDGVRPRVDAVTPVNRGAVLRVRVGLHSAQPPVTRVVLDVSRLPASRIEPGDSDAQLRIVIGDVAVAADAPPAEELLQRDRAWCLDISARLAALLDELKPSTSQAEMLARSTAWEKLEREVDGRKLVTPLQPIHHTLLQSIRLARIAAGHLRAREPDQAAAALAGARLLLHTAQDKLAH
jgi:hypothetical protein